MRPATTALVIGLLPLALAAPAAAATNSFSIYSTGVDSSGHLLADGSVDPHWTVQTESYDNAPCLPCDGIGPAGGPFLSDYDPTAYVGSAAYTPTSFPGGPSFYGLNTPTAGMIAWSTDNEGSYVPYTYRETFMLTAAEAATASLSMTVYSDDDGALALNGHLVPATYVFRSGPENVTLTGGFVAGVNTLDIVAYNEGGAGGVFLSVDSATWTATPEPAGFAVVAVGLGVLGLLRRGRQGAGAPG